MKLAEPAPSRPPATPRFVGVNKFVMEYMACSHIPGVAPLGCATPSEELYPADKLLRLAAAIGRRQPSVASRYVMDHRHRPAEGRNRAARVEFGCNLTPRTSS